jgi:hypothetical protein
MKRAPLLLLVMAILLALASAAAASPPAAAGPAVMRTPGGRVKEYVPAAEHQAVSRLSKRRKKKKSSSQQEEPTQEPQAGDTATASPGADDVARVTEAAKNAKDKLSCFPASATVTLASGARVRMDALAVGDAVAVGGSARPSPVFMFTHREKAGVHAFVRLTTAAGAALSLSPGHYVYAGGALVRADAVRVGDELRLAGGSASGVVAVGATLELGLYNPQTLHGDIVVDGVVASTYTAAVEPAVAHAALAPLRAAFACFGYSTGALDAGAPPTFVGRLPAGGVAY